MKNIASLTANWCINPLMLHIHAKLGECVVKIGEDRLHRSGFLAILASPLRRNGDLHRWDSIESKIKCKSRGGISAAFLLIGRWNKVTCQWIVFSLSIVMHLFFQVLLFQIPSDSISNPNQADSSVRDIWPSNVLQQLELSCLKVGMWTRGTVDRCRDIYEGAAMAWEPIWRCKEAPK